MKMFVALLALVSLSAFASPMEGLNLEGLTDHHKCPGLDITEAQKEEIKSVIQSTRQKTKKYKPGVKAAKKALISVMMDPTSTKKQARMAIRNFRVEARPLKKLMMKAKMKVGFDILSGEQRVIAIKCMKKSAKKKCGGKKPFEDFSL